VQNAVSSLGNLLDACDSGSTERVHAAVSALTAQIRKEARDIRDKYVAPPARNDSDFLLDKPALHC
jgi:DNA anti-recombination protein RmuC